MAKRLIEDSTMTNIADAIREKAGITNSLFPGDMASYIRAIQTTESDTTGVPADIVTEAERVASGMIPKIAANSITFLAMSDTHEFGDSDTADASTLERYRRANLNAGQAAKLISDKIPLDFFAHLGDFAWGSSTTPIAEGVDAIVRVREYVADVVKDNETFMTPGNHDSLYYSYAATGEALGYTVLSGLIGTYRYLDYADKKVRVICLNTADNNGDGTAKERISGEQLQWFCEALDLSGKSDAADWGIIILSHHPLDWSNVRFAGNILAAYVEGGSYSNTHDGVAVSYDFSGKNAAKIIANFHGHVHGFRVDCINDLRNTSAPVPTTVKRVAIPNACFGRNNEYGRNNDTEYYGIEFGEETTYAKTDDSTGKNTAFCLVSIDLDEEIIYADCFGAGYDRIVSYAVEEPVTYIITNSLANASNSNGATVVTEGSSYSAAITANDGYELESVTVTMGGTDITASAVSGGNITIASVTGDVIITATTVILEDFDYGVFTNLVPTATTTYNGTEIYNGIGYRNDTYVSSNHAYKDNNGTVAVGYLRISPTEAIYIKGAELSTDEHVRLYPVSASGSAMYYCEGTGLNLSAGTWSTNSGTLCFYVETLGTNYYKITPNTEIINADVYYRISLVGTGENLIITHNETIHDSTGEEVEPVTYTVTNNLTNVINGNTVASVEEGASYSATLTATSGYEISSVTVTMGGTDITSTAYTNGAISITNVTGNIVITAVAEEIQLEVTYTNLVPTSIDPSTGSIYGEDYNGDGTPDGYKNGYYASGATEKEDAACVLTGIIPYGNDSTTPIYIKGADITDTSHCRIITFNATKSVSIQSAYGTALATYFTVETLGTSYYKVTPTQALLDSAGQTDYLRFSLIGTGENLIITLNEPIE